MRLIILFLAVFLAYIPASYAQNEKNKAQFDKKLLCPFENGTGREPKEAYTWDPPDQKVIMISRQDSVIRSCIDGKVITVNPTEDGGYEIVFYHGDYYFWYYGVKKPLVNVGQSIKASQPIATYTLGHEMEFRMFLNEDAMDPRPYLECKKAVEIN